MAYTEWEKFFKEEYADEVFVRYENAESYFAHFANHFENTSYQLEYDSKAACMQLAQKYCPKVYETLLRFF